MLQAKANKLGLRLPGGLATDPEIQTMLSVRDHEEAHAKLETMDDLEVAELVRKIIENARRKRARATERYLVEEEVI